MGSSIRKLRRSRLLKKRKDTKESLKQALSATAGFPANCTFCDAKFVSERDSDTWVVEFKKTEKIRLLCPGCARKA